jgi:hypothetical protein
MYILLIKILRDVPSYMVLLIDCIPGTGQTAMVMARFLTRIGTFLQSQSPPYLLGTGSFLSGTKENKRGGPLSIIRYGS